MDSTFVNNVCGFMNSQSILVFSAKSINYSQGVSADFIFSFPKIPNNTNPNIKFETVELRISAKQANSAHWLYFEHLHSQVLCFRYFAEVWLALNIPSASFYIITEWNNACIRCGKPNLKANGYY